MAERVDFVPRHEGDYVFPGDQLFTCLLHLAHLPGQPFAVRDVNAGIERTHAQLLSDVLNYRGVIKNNLSPDVLRAVGNRKEIYIHILALGGYEFTVAFFATLALGAVAVPICKLIPSLGSCS